MNLLTVEVKDLKPFHLDWLMSKELEVNFNNFNFEEFKSSWDRGEFRYTTDKCLALPILEKIKIEMNTSPHRNFFSLEQVAVIQNNSSLDYVLSRTLTFLRFGEYVKLPKEIYDIGVSV